MIAPTGTATSPASSSATSQGKPWSVVKCAIDDAPMAAKAYWHSDTWRDSRVSRPSDNTRITRTSALAYTVTLVPTHDGTRHSTPTNTTPARTRIRVGACQLVRIVRGVRNRRGASFDARGHEQHHEQDDERKPRGQADQPGDVHHVLGGQGAADPDQETADVGERQVGEVADRRRTERLDDQQREDQRLHRQARGDQETRQRGERRTDDPRPAPDAHRALSRHREQLGVVDHPAHRGAEPRRPQEQVERDGRDQGDDRHDDLLPLDVDATQLDRRRREERREAVGDVAQPDAAHCDDPQDEPHRRRDLQRVIDRCQSPRQQLQQDPHDRAEHEHAHERGQRPRPPVLHVQPVEDEDRHRRQRAVGEVEDARCLVLQHQAGACETVDGPDRDPDDDERPDLAHGLGELSSSRRMPGSSRWAA